MENDDRELDWLTEMDKEILDVLGSDLTLTPSVIADNIDRSREGVGNRLSTLQAGGLVEKVDRGKYQLTDEGFRLFSDFELPELSDAERIGARDENIKHRRRIHRDFGVSLEEYHEALSKELAKIQGGIQDREAINKAIKKAEEKLREES
jgi:restriction endonuclease Mrr